MEPVDITCHETEMQVESVDRLQVTLHQDHNKTRSRYTFDRLASADFYAVADLTCGNWQIEIEESLRKSTAYCTRMGSFQFRRVPIGIKNIPAEFEMINMRRCVSRRLHNLVIIF